MKSLVRFIYYRLQRVFLSLFYDYQITYNISSRYIGNKYGGFYTHIDNINSTSIVLSFGIGKDISFDEQIINITNCYVYAFDPTPDSIEWVNSLNKHNHFLFYPFGIGLSDMKSKFYLPLNRSNISGSIYSSSSNNSSNPIQVELRSIESITKMLNLDHIDILKLDIEGLEFDILQNLPYSLIIKQIIVEFHNRNFSNGNLLAKITINKLYNQGFRLYSISETNTELSFINIKYI